MRKKNVGVLTYYIYEVYLFYGRRNTKCKNPKREAYRFTHINTFLRAIRHVWTAGCRWSSVTLP